MTEVCRTCLEEIPDRCFLSLSDASNGVKKELAFCIPELDLGLVPQAAVCVYCARALHAAFDFKQRCLQTEEKIRSHMKGRRMLDLGKIKQDPTMLAQVDSSLQVPSGPGLGLEVIYIRDDGSLDVGSHEGELIVGQVHEPVQPPEPRVEPVKLFLNASHDLSSQVLAGGLLTTTHNSHPTSNSIKKRNYIKEEPKSFYNGNDDDVVRSYDCPRCSFSARSAYLLKQHVKSHSVLKSRDLPMHAANGETHFKCSMCDFTAVSRLKMSHHMRAHSGAALQCPCCKFQTKYKVALHNHMKTHNLVLPTTTTAIKKEAKSYKCKQCPFETAQKQAFQYHVDNHERDKNLKCSSCSYVASNLTTFQRHLNSHSLKKPIKIAFRPDADFTVKDKPFSIKNKTIQCPTCTYSSPNKHRMAAHILIHTGEKPFACHLCQYRGNQKGHLDKHLQNHEGDRPWKCSECSYNVNTQFHLALHMKVHNEEPAASSPPIQP